MDTHGMHDKEPIPERGNAGKPDDVRRLAPACLITPDAAISARLAITMMLEADAATAAGAMIQSFDMTIETRRLMREALAQLQAVCPANGHWQAYSGELGENQG